MKKLIIALTAIVITASAYAQGTVQFNNRIVGTVDALVKDSTGAGVSAGFTAQLYASATASGTLVAVPGTTTFRTGAAAGYVNAIDVAIPGIAGGAQATIVMRAFNGATYETSTIRGSSAPITIALGGGGSPPAPAAALANMVGFTVAGTVIPEPSTIALGTLGLAMLLIRRRK